jgi:hypothetical protein
MKANAFKDNIITPVITSKMGIANNIIQRVRGKRMQIPILVIDPSEKTDQASIEHISGGKR